MKEMKPTYNSLEFLFDKDGNSKFITRHMGQMHPMATCATCNESFYNPEQDILQVNDKRYDGKLGCPHCAYLVHGVPYWNPLKSA